jgi:hypothetical protein
LVVVKRRTILQDVARSYSVFIDGQIVGELWPFQTGRYRVTPGSHTVRSAIINTGTSSSDALKIEATVGSTTIIQTKSRGIVANLMTPFAIPAGVKALSTGDKISSVFYEPPWIHTKVQVRVDGS